MNIVDPTMMTEQDHIEYAPRPKNLRGLRVAIIENTKKNSELVLLKLAAKLQDVHGMKMQLLMHKPQRDPLRDAQLEELIGEADVAISGVGD